MRWIISLFGKDGRESRSTGRHRFVRNDLLLDVAEPVVDVMHFAILHIDGMPTKATSLGKHYSFSATVRNLDLGSNRIGAIADIHCLGLGYLGRVRVVDIAVAGFGHLRTWGSQNFD